MKFKILGSGGMYPTPLPHCHCKVCESARNGNNIDIRSMPALFLEDIKLLIDTPEDIFNTLEKIILMILIIYQYHTEILIMLEE